MADASSPNSPGSRIVRSLHDDALGIGLELAELPPATPGGQTRYTAAAFWHSVNANVPHGRKYDSASSATLDAMLRLGIVSGRKVEGNNG